MNGELLRIVDSIHRDKNIDKEIIFQGIEAALLSAAKKHYHETEEVLVTIDRDTGNISAYHDGETIDPEFFGRIAAQTAKQVMIQKIREAERDALYDEYDQLVGQIVTGTVGRQEGGAVVVNLGKTEGILPRSEQIPGESHHTSERVRALILDARKSGSRVKIILSRTHPGFVRRLFELEIPEISERIIEVKALAREAGYRTKVAVSTIDPKVDCVGACVGVRGTRIKNIVDELGGERIDIVRWNDALEVLIPNALQPAEIEEVILCRMLGRAIVLVREDQLSLAIGRRGQNVRLASKLCGWDIEIMTRDELDEQLDRALEVFTQVPHISPELTERLVQEGFFSYDDLSIIEPDHLMTMGNLSAEQAAEIIAYAEREAERLDQLRAQQAAQEVAARTEGVSSTEPTPPDEPVSEEDQTAGLPPHAAPEAESAAAAEVPEPTGNAAADRAVSEIPEPLPGSNDEEPAAAPNPEEPQTESAGVRPPQPVSGEEVMMPSETAEESDQKAEPADPETEGEPSSTRGPVASN